MSLDATAMDEFASGAVEGASALRHGFGVGITDTFEACLHQVFDLLIQAACSLVRMGLDFGRSAGWWP